jgi:FMN hydrolase / 5-amino-6-(5-phospho-D-ribitylamino)uracil phosphatase
VRSASQNPPIVTFDAGQTLVELDLDFLAARAAVRGVVVEPAALAQAAPAAWRHYDELIDAGTDHAAAWRALISRFLGGHADVAAWLFEQNARANLWRRPISAMVDLARECRRRGARVGVLSNSEGRLAALLDEVGIADPFEVIVDSGVVGIAKPDPRIFEHALAALGAAEASLAIHIGDSFEADVAGARRAGWRAIWYGRHVRPTADPAVAIALDAAAARAALAGWLDWR